MHSSSLDVHSSSASCLEYGIYSLVWMRYVENKKFRTAKIQTKKFRTKTGFQEKFPTYCFRLKMFKILLHQKNKYFDDQNPGIQ